jgi:hypothetical protein
MVHLPRLMPQDSDLTKMARSGLCCRESQRPSSLGAVMQVLVDFLAEKNIL